MQPTLKDESKLSLYPRGIAVKPDPDHLDITATVAITDCHHHRVAIVRLNTPRPGEDRVECLFGREGTREGSFSTPAGVAFGLDGSIIVADQHNHRCQIFNADGSLLRSIGSKGLRNGCFDCPLAVTVSEHGNIFVQDRSSVQMLRANGSFVAEPVEAEMSAAQLGGIAYNGTSGTLVVCESCYERHRVHIVSSFV